VSLASLQYRLVEFQLLIDALFFAWADYFVQWTQKFP